MFVQKSVSEVEKNGHKVVLICDSDTPLGILHDVLMELKGYTVERMLQAQKQEEEISKKMQEEKSEEK